MLRTFASNSALGGFGETTTPDAFCQIIKELVDNAVDACVVDKPEIVQKKRVRVVIEHHNEKTLRVTVTDNGCGMSDIQACVGAFTTNKAHNKKSKSEQQTAGRYGMGLTLCLLHAQRLVPGSCAAIRSAMVDQRNWTSVNAVVDTASDCVRCILKDTLPKGLEDESGTTVSVLVPGGEVASLAWPRLAEYFARFTLSLGMSCSLEVLAPSLSRVPLFIQNLSPRCATSPNSEKRKAAPIRKKKASRSSQQDQRNGPRCGDDTSIQEISETETRVAAGSNQQMAMYRAASSYLGKPVQLENVAHAIVPIAAKKGQHGKRKKNRISIGPQLEVNLIVYGPNDESDEESTIAHVEDNPTDDRKLTNLKKKSTKSAQLILVRMVNKVPLLDSTEDIACGLVQSLACKQRIWNSFGLNVSIHSSTYSVDKPPTYEVYDSEQVTPFLKKGQHTLLENPFGDDSRLLSELVRATDTGTSDIDEPRKHRCPMIPASSRLGNILIIVQIHAEPSMLPLPTLSKGRLPVDNKEVDAAVESGLSKCLQQIQTSNPNLLLTAHELSKSERDTRYVPAVALALASIISKSANVADESLKEQPCLHHSDDESSSIASIPVSVNNKGGKKNIQGEENSFQDKDFQTQLVEKLGISIERKLHFALAHDNIQDPLTTTRKQDNKQTSQTTITPDDVHSSESGDNLEDRERESSAVGNSPASVASGPYAADEYEDWL